MRMRQAGAVGAALDDAARDELGRAEAAHSSMHRFCTRRWKFMQVSSIYGGANAVDRAFVNDRLASVDSSRPFPAAWSAIGTGARATTSRC